MIKVGSNDDSNKTFDISYNRKSLSCFMFKFNNLNLINTFDNK